MKKKNVGFLLVATICAASLQSTEITNATTGITTAEGLSTCLADTTQDNCELSGDFELGTTLSITRDVTILGNNYTITRAAGFTDSLFTTTSETNVTINGLKIDGNAPDWTVDTTPENIQFYFNACASASDCRVYGGYTFTPGENDVAASASIINNAGNLTIKNSQIKNAYNTNSGGAITTTGDLTIDESTFEHNTAHSGGAIYNKTATTKVTITNSNFNNNNAGHTSGFSNPQKSGGAIASNSDELTIKDSTFSNNTAQNDGGAVKTAKANLVIEDSNFNNNKTSNDGSAIRLGIDPTNSTPIVHATASIKGSNFDGNISLGSYWPNNQVKPGTDIPAKSNSEGAISFYSAGYSTIELKDSTFKNGKASWGSALSAYTECSASDIQKFGEHNCQGAEYLLDNITVSDNMTDADSIYIYTDKDVTIKNSSISRNTPAAISIYSTADITVSDTEISNNGSETAKNTAIFSKSANLTLDNVTYSENAGRIVSDNKNTTIKDSTLSGTKNQSALYIYSAANGSTNTVTIDNTKIIDNTTSANGAGIYASNKANADLVINLTGTTEITGNAATHTEESGNNGTGGGISIINSNSGTVTLNVDDTVKLEQNEASISGDDISVKSNGDSGSVTLNLPKSFMADDADNRADDDSTLTQQQLSVTSGQTLNIANAPRSSYIAQDDSSDDDADTNNTDDADTDTTSTDDTATNTADDSNNESTKASNPITLDNGFNVIFIAIIATAATAIAAASLRKRK